MHIDEVRRLIQLVEESEIDELDIWKWWGRVRIRKTAALDGSRAIQILGSGAMSVPPPAAPVARPAEPQTSEPDEEAGLVPIASPMVGTMYRAPAPDAEPYVQPGDLVEPGQTVCIVEAMKLMNEIQSEVRGKIVRVLVENGQPVEFGQPLFLIQEM
jgi:acetyl-CoA carboxylase biotin carboxyl carrier protein